MVLDHPAVRRRKPASELCLTRMSSRNSGGSPQEIFQRWVEIHSAGQEAHEGRPAGGRRFKPRVISVITTAAWRGLVCCGWATRPDSWTPFFRRVFFWPCGRANWRRRWSENVWNAGKPDAAPFRRIRKARPPGAEVLLARGGELLHHAVHGDIPAARATIATSPPPSTPCSPENWRADGRCAGAWSISFCSSKSNAASRSCRAFFSAPSRARKLNPIPRPEKT